MSLIRDGESVPLVSVVPGDVTPGGDVPGSVIPL